MGINKPTIKSVELTKTLYADKIGDKFTINIKKFRKEFSKTFPSVSKIDETGDAMSFWNALIQIINSLILKENSTETNIPRSITDKNSSMIYEKMGIQYMISKDYDDFEITSYFQTCINVSILEVITIIKEEYW